MKMIASFLLFLIFNLVAITNAMCQHKDCVKNKIIIKSYQINSIPLAEIDSVIAKSQPFKIEVDSFFNNRKISTAMLDGERVTGYKFYIYNSKGNLLKTVVRVPGTNFKGDSTVYTYDNIGRITSTTSYDRLDEDHIYSEHFKYKNGKTYLTAYVNNKAAVTNVFWRNKSKNRRYSRVLNSKTDFDYYLKKYDKHGEVVSEEECLNNKCTVGISYVLKYNKCGIMTRKLTLGSDQKIFSAVTYNIE